MAKETDKKFRIECSCTSNDHDIIVWVDKEEGDVAIYCTLTHYQGFWKRLRCAFRYVFGIDNTYIHYTEVFMSIEEYEAKFGKIAEYIKEE